MKKLITYLLLANTFLIISPSHAVEFESKIYPSTIDPNDEFGIAVDVVDNLAVIGAHNDDENAGFAGAAYILRYQGGVWVEEQKLLASDGDHSDKFGFSVSLSETRVLIGAYSDNEFADDCGAVYVFDYDGQIWSETQKITPTICSEDALFGWSVDLDGDRAIIGARTELENLARPGAAYIFDFDGVSWDQTQRIIPNGVVHNDFFGMSVSLSGDNAIISAPGKNEFSGAVYFYKLNNNTWEFHDQIINLTEYDWVGYSVSISEDIAVIGASGDSGDLLEDSGAAYIYRLVDDQWVHDQMVRASDAEAIDEFGRVVKVNDGKVLISSQHAGDYGKAYVFEHDGSAWEETNILIPEAGNGTPKLFGASLGFSNKHIIVGAPKESTNNGVTTGAGFHYIFDGIFLNGFD